MHELKEGRKTGCDRFVSYCYGSSRAGGEEGQGGGGCCLEKKKKAVGGWGWGGVASH